MFDVNSGFISGLILENVFVDKSHIDDYMEIGGLTGRNMGVGTVANCSVHGIVRSSRITGGIAGYNWGKVINSTFSGEVRNISNRDAATMLAEENPRDVAGGIVGVNEGVVADCTATGQITSSFIAGGVVGINFSAISRAKVFNSKFIYASGFFNRLVAPI